MDEEILSLFESDEDQIEESNEIAEIMEDGISDEVTDESTEESDTTEEVVDQVEATEQSTQEESNFKLPFKYNHEQGEITDIAEAQRLVQIGMMYQNKIAPEFEQLKAISEPYEKIAQVANLYDMDVNTLTESLMAQYYEQQATVQGITPEMVKKELELSEKERRLQEKETVETEKTKSNEMYQRFLEVYPEVDVKNISADTWAMVNNGVDLITAYTKQINEELKQQLKLKEQNLKNKSTSPVGSVTKNGTAEPVKEDFADELLSYFK